MDEIINPKTLLSTIDGAYKTLQESMKELTNIIIKRINIRDKQIMVNFTHNGVVIQYLTNEHTPYVTIIINYIERMYAIQNTQNSDLINRITSVVNDVLNIEGKQLIT